MSEAMNYGRDREGNDFPFVPARVTVPTPAFIAQTATPARLLGGETFYTWHRGYRRCARRWARSITPRTLYCRTLPEDLRPALACSASRSDGDVRARDEVVLPTPALPMPPSLP